MSYTAAVAPLLFAMRTDSGRVRTHNEDACAADAALGIFVVCDGIGGGAAGEVASHLAAVKVVETLRLDAFREPPTNPGGRLDGALRRTNGLIFAAGRRARHLRGMGTTIVALLLAPAEEAALPDGGRSFAVAHAGDSRCYRLREGALELITGDHSYVAEQVRAGYMTHHEATRSPMRSVITSALGVSEEMEPEVQRLTAQPGDLYLLASDGLTLELTDEEIATELRDLPSGAALTAASLEERCDHLIAMANAAGGHDNITVLLLQLPAAEA